jgi:hypothetical protein
MILTRVNISLHAQPIIFYSCCKIGAIRNPVLSSPFAVAVATMETLAPLGSPPPVHNTIQADPATLKSILQDHGGDNGYSIAVGSSKAQRIIYKCSKGGKYRDGKDPKIHKSKRRKNTSTMKTDYPFQVDAKKCVD